VDIRAVVYDATSLALDIGWRYFFVCSELMMLWISKHASEERRMVVRVEKQSSHAMLYNHGGS